jgi:hypothetical protein
VAEDLNRTRSIIELLRQTTSLGVVGEFLKSKSLHHSAGTWDEMQNKRLLPAVEGNQLTNADLIQLLQSAEESGKQHIFLYSCPRAHAADLMDETRVRSVLKSMGISAIWGQPKVLYQPATPTIVDVRLEGVGRGQMLTIKEIELRTHQRYERTEHDGDFLRKIYKIHKERVVNLARLHATGFLEIRIGSHANSSKYEQDINRFWTHIFKLLPPKEFMEVSLSKAKSNVLVNRKSLGQLIRYSDSTLRNDNGVVLRAATGSDGSDLASDKGAQNSIDAFMAEDGECEGLNFFFRPAAGLPKEVHVLLFGEVNEFAIPANCTEGDYRYVLDQIRSLNK